MEDKIYLVSPSSPSSILSSMISEINPYKTIVSPLELMESSCRAVLFSCELSPLGYDYEMLKFLEELKSHDAKLNHCRGALLIHSSSDLYTKDFAQQIIYLLNSMGMCFIGHPLVEATSTLRNFATWQKTLPLSLEEIALLQAKKLGLRLREGIVSHKKPGKITVLYSSPHKSSNTLQFWHLVKEHLGQFQIDEIQIENGKVVDCKGCSYTLCLHYGKQHSCFYGGFMVEDILPAIELCDVLLFLCPNYNDSISANLTAVINRLTVLYNLMSFHTKAVLGIVVSGNSGGDSVAKQLIGALNINKGFYLPPKAVFTATANDPNDICKIPNIFELAETYAEQIKAILK